MAEQPKPSITGVGAAPARIESRNGGVVDGNLHAARSPLKVLNHLGLSRHYDAIARRLGVHYQGHDQRLYEANREVLAWHQEAAWRNSPGNSKILTARIGPYPVHPSNAPSGLAPATGRAVASLCENAKKYGIVLDADTVRAELRDYSAAAQLELHPSDICNEKCRGCTYGHDDPTIKPPAICFPFSGLEQVARLQPKSIVIVGGGEPLLYRDRETGRRFPEFMDRLHEMLPGCRFGLISNGTIFPDGAWYRHFDWIRFSVDAADAGTYARVRGRDLFDRVSANLVTLLRLTTTQQINVGFVFSRENVRDAAKAALYFFDLADDFCPEALGRLCVEYRPLRKDLEGEGRDFPEAVTDGDVALAVAGFRGLASGRPRFAEFLRVRTNWEIIQKGNSHEIVGFGHCGYSSIFRLIRASGEVRPCCMRLAGPEFYMGNMLVDSPESIGLNLLYNAHYLRPGCDGPGCKLGRVNRLIEEGLAGRAVRATDSAIASNPFFG
jgi:hypothetical protein